MIVLARVTGSKVEDAAPSRRRHRSVGTLETVVVRCGEGSWPEAATARSQLGNSDTLASGPAKSPVCLRTGLTSQSAVCG